MKRILEDNKKYLILFSIILLFVFLLACNGVTPTTYTIIATAGTGGSILPMGSITVTEGESKTFTITPDEGYQIDDVQVDGTSVGAVSTFPFINIYQNHTIQASFILSPKVYNDDTGIGYNTIQEAINTALVGQTIIVSSGTYFENLLFSDKDIIVRSTDPSNPDIVAATIIDGRGSGSTVKFINGDSSTLGGFTIQNGCGEKYYTYHYGGGIYLESSSPTITGNIITQNEAAKGGGIGMMSSSPTITGNIITQNEADDGGGIFATITSYPTIIYNTITHNKAAGFGGGIYVAESSDLYPETARPTGWGKHGDANYRQNVPPYNNLPLAGNTFSENIHYNNQVNGEDVYFAISVSLL